MNINLCIHRCNLKYITITYETQFPLLKNMNMLKERFYLPEVDKNQHSKYDQN